MLSALVKESQAKQAKLKALNDGNRKQALAATESVANLMTDNVQGSVNEVYAAQNKLEKELKGLQTNTAHFAKQTYQWLEMIKTFNGSLKACVCVRVYVRACTHTRLLRARALADHLRELLAPPAAPRLLR
jgi:biogenesis of lysosome-related organelles complex 1 subunit 1